MLVIMKMEDGGQYYEKNIHSHLLSYVVNADGMVVVGDKIYQHTIDKIKVLNSTDLNRIHELEEANTPGVFDDISVFSVNNTFVRSCSGDDGRLRILVYQNFTQNPHFSIPSNKVTTYKITVRSLRKRLFWYDNYKTTMTLTGNSVGNDTPGWRMQNNTFTFINWSNGYSDNFPGMTNTWEYFLPKNSGLGISGFRTEGNDPQIYQSWHTGKASRGGRTAICTTIYFE